MINHACLRGENLAINKSPFSVNVLSDSHCIATDRLNAAVIFHTVLVTFALNIRFGAERIGCMQMLGRKNFPLHSVILNLVHVLRIL